MSIHRTHQDRVLAIVKEAGIMRPRDLDRHGIPREILRRLCTQGLVIRVGHGLYTMPETEATEYHTLAQVCKRVPFGVVCLLSALRFHDLTTQTPRHIWMAIDMKARKPQMENMPVHFVRFSGKALNEGIENHTLEGVEVKIYNQAKTVADCFKYRNKIGLDVAIEALKDCMKAKRCKIDDLWYYAKICRVSNLIRPYLEALVE